MGSVQVPAVSCYSNPRSHRPHSCKKGKTERDDSYRGGRAGRASLGLGWLRFHSSSYKLCNEGDRLAGGLEQRWSSGFSPSQRTVVAFPLARLGAQGSLTLPVGKTSEEKSVGVKLERGQLPRERRFPQPRGPPPRGSLCGPGCRRSQCRCAPLPLEPARCHDSGPRGARSLPLSDPRVTECTPRPWVWEGAGPAA